MTTFFRSNSSDGDDGTSTSRVLREKLRRENFQEKRENAMKDPEREILSPPTESVLVERVITLDLSPLDFSYLSAPF